MKQQHLFFSLLMVFSLVIFCQQMTKSPDQTYANNNIFIATMENMTRTNTYLEEANEKNIQSIKTIAKHKLQYMPLAHINQQIYNSAKDMNQYITDLKEIVGKASGGVFTAVEEESNLNPALIGMPKAGNNKNGVKQVLLAKQGEALYQKLTELKEEYLKNIGDLWTNGGIRGTIFCMPSQKAETLYQLDKKRILLPNKEIEKETWLQDLFEDKTVEEAYITLTNIQNNINLSASSLIHLLSEQVGLLDLSYDRFGISIDAPKSKITLGEPYEAKIALSTFSSQAEFTYSVDGEYLNVEYSQGNYKITPTSLGEKSYQARISVKNPLTGEIETFAQTFTYEVVKSD